MPVRDRTSRTLRGQAQADHIPFGEIGNVERREWSAVASFGEVSFPALFGACARIEDFLHFGFTLMSNPHARRHGVEQRQGIRIREKSEAVESSQVLEDLLGDLSRIRQLGRDVKVFEGSDHSVFLRVQANGLSRILEPLGEGPSFRTDDDSLVEEIQAGPCRIRDVERQDGRDVVAT